MPLGVLYLCALALGVGAWVAPLTDSALSALVYFAGFIAEFPLTDIRLKKPPLIFLPLYAMACIALYLAPRKGRIAVIAFVIAGVFLASGQSTPKGAITGTVTKDSSFIRFAYLDEGRLYHTHRLSDFWTDSYQKLLGLYDVSTYVACRYGCTITLSNDDKIIIVKTNRTISCPAGRGLIIAPRAVACDGYQMIMIDERHISIKLFHSNELGYYPHRKTKPQPHRVWRIF